MELFKLVLCCILLFPCSISFAEQRSDVYRGKLVSMSEGARVLPLSRESAAFINPALLGLDSLKFNDFGVALSFPLSIVNMPISVGISPKVQRVDTYNYAAVTKPFEVGELGNTGYRNDETQFNLDIGVAMEPVEGIIVAMSGRNLINKKLETLESEGRRVNYRVVPEFTVGVTYDWNSLSVTTDIALNAHKRLDETADSQYWRLGGEMRATDWFSLRLGYRHDMKDNTSNIYSLGTGFAIGQVFYLDLTGMVSSDDAIGGVLQTSYHF